MIIYGFKTVESVTSAGTFSCPRCRNLQTYRRLAHSRWFTLFFVPVIPLGRAGEQVECQGCFARYSPDILLAGPGLEPLAAIVVEEGASAHQPATPWMREAPQTSAWAITSLLLGLLSPVLLCACGLSIISSLGAIVTGHLALVKIRRAAGGLVGRGLAIAGLALGYLLLAVSIGLWGLLGPSFYEGWQTAHQRAEQPEGAAAPPRDAANRLYDAEMRILTTSTEGVASGNSPAAQQLARDYARSLQVMRDALFTKDRERVFSLTDGKFLVHCELHPGRCAFLVHVPSYRDFTPDAKEALEASAWMVAQRTVAETLAPGDALAVGLRGAVLYGAVLVGEVEDEAGTSDNFTRAQREALLAFFPVPEESDAPAGSSPPADSQPAEAFAEAPAFAESPAERAPGSASPPFANVDADEKATSPPSGSSSQPLLPPVNPRRETASAKPAPTPRADLVHAFSDLGWGVESLAFSPDGHYLAAGKMDAALLWFDVRTGTPLPGATELRDLSQVQVVAFSHDGGRLFAGGFRGTIRAWSVTGAGRLEPASSLRGHADAVTCLVASPAAPFVLSGSAKGELLWQAYDKPGAAARTFAAFDRAVLAAHLPEQGTQAWATDGRRLLGVDLRQAQIVRTHQLGRGAAHAAAFSRDGGTLAVSDGYDIHLWNTATGAKVASLSASPEIQWSVLFLPDGERLLSGGRGQVTLWGVSEAKLLDRFDLGGVLYVKTLAVTPDGSLMAAIPSAAGQTLTVHRLPLLP